MDKDSKFFTLQAQLINDRHKGQGNFHVLPDIG